jgi:tRNA wybutosine-synthesizing protein 1
MDVQRAEKPNQLTDGAKEAMQRQQYRIVGKHNHSAVKTCGWTKKMVKGEGGCYKLKFYGIMSHQCLQMTTSISCANRCTFCWRDYKAPVSEDWRWAEDSPQTILEESIKEHLDLLVGYKGNDKTTKNVFDQSRTVKHVALSLTGEPIIYPKINELLGLFNKEGISTFLVTNAQYPEQIRDLNPVTQLYISLDASNPELLKKVDVPLFKDYWERLNKSLEYMAQKNYRTCIRLTIVNGVNDSGIEDYSKLIILGNPDFIEVKGYMFVGASRERLTKKNMPWHEEVVSFSKELVKFLDDYEIVSEHIPSRVVMLAKKKFKINNEWKTWIDFSKWHELVLSGQEFGVMDFVKKTPQIGLSGRQIQKEVEETKRKKREGIYVNEDSDEIDFWKEDEQSIKKPDENSSGGC